MMLFAASLVQVSVILGVALAVVATLRRRSAALRHWVLAAAIIGALASPIVPLLASTWKAASQESRWTVTVVERGVIARNERTAVDAGTLPLLARRWMTDVRDAFERLLIFAAAVPQRVHAQLPFLLVFLWATGTVVLSIRLCRQLWQLHRYSRRLERVDEQEWLSSLPETARRLGIRRRIMVLNHPDPALVVTWGTWNPRVLLPVDARQWTDERIRVVLAHELAHIRRRDWSLQIAAGVLQATYWFHPLAWLAAAALRREAERACDDLVLATGIAAPDYAAHLVDIARAAIRQPLGTAAPAVAHPSTLEERVRAMLNTHLDRRPLTALARLGSAVIASAVVLAVMALSPRATAQTGYGSISAVIYDQSGGLLPGVTVAARHAESGRTSQQKTDATGAFAMTNVPSGTWDITTTLAGFSTVRNTIDLQPGDFVQRSVVLPLGSLEETITIVGSAEPGIAAPPPAPRARPVRNQPTPRAPSLDPRGIGGNIRTPSMLYKVNPIFPAELGGQAAVVTARGRIGIDGFIADLQDVSQPPAPAAFVNALLTAVRQWEFTPTLLNGAPVEANITITGRFTSR
jgi:beta-lactamase regulating signal transducer with metallopeptidase domain